MRMYDILYKKRNGEALSEAEIRYIIDGYVKGEIPDYQISAWLMAVYFQGMTDEELAVLTASMRDSGDQLDLSRFGERSVDKHSTGGVGDKTTLIVTPIVAALGGKVAKMSGRGLGHTGGTVDKLESIPGFQITLPPKHFMEQVEKIGVAVIGQSGNMTPADKKLYALRDVTATIDSIPLIASSVMSKKLAAGAYNIVLDVKVGSGAFMQELSEAQILAQKMVAIGKSCGRNVTAILTNMNIPLGYAIGNRLEVMEAVQVLKGNGPADLTEICILLAAHMLKLCCHWDLDEAKEKAKQALQSGAALAVFTKWIQAQGGAIDWIEKGDLPLSPAYPIYAPQDGYIAEIDSKEIGMACVQLGAGRAKKEDAIDYGAGVVLAAKVGDELKKGQILATMYTNQNESEWKAAEARILQAITFQTHKPAPQQLVYGVVES